MQSLTYSGKGAKELMDVLERNNAEVERLIRAVQGFVSFFLVRTASGGFSVSVFQDKAGTDESVRVAQHASSPTRHHSNV
jgi:heme-degrading monooxygenase HmoA